jgi:hypothetical protein
MCEIGNLIEMTNPGIDPSLDYLDNGPDRVPVGDFWTADPT